MAMMSGVIAELGGSREGTAVRMGAACSSNVLVLCVQEGLEDMGLLKKVGGEGSSVVIGVNGRFG